MFLGMAKFYRLLRFEYIGGNYLNLSKFKERNIEPKPDSRNLFDSLY